MNFYILTNNIQQMLSSKLTISVQLMPLSKLSQQLFSDPQYLNNTYCVMCLQYGHHFATVFLMHFLKVMDVNLEKWGKCE